MNVLFVTNIPSPYRVDFFNEFGKECDLTVCYERKRSSDRDEKWVGLPAQNYKEVYPDLKPYGACGSKGNGIAKYIKANKSDILIFSGYASPSVMAAMLYCQRHRIQYFIEYDGGFNKKDRFYKRVIKKRMISRAAGHFITCGELKKYLSGFGVPDHKIHFYPFSSTRTSDVANSVVDADTKQALRGKLGVVEKKMVLAVGQFIHRKGFDILLRAASEIDKSTGVYIVGGIPTEQYLSMKETMDLSHVHFVGFKTKEELKEYYNAADIFVMPTREDIWGLVVNEAMACGLPVISSNACIAALEMVEDGKSGYVVQSEDCEAFKNAINTLVSDENKIAEFSKRSLEIACKYTIENMAESHLEIIKNEMNKA